MSLKDLFAGRADGAGSLLHNCRLEGAGANAFGAEAIREILRTEPRSAEFIHVIEGPRHAALFTSPAGGSFALFADLSGKHITRLWYLGPRALQSHSTERVDVPIDPSFGQMAAGLQFDHSDHPHLASSHLARLTALAVPLLDPTATEQIPLRSASHLTRLRASVLRAFSAKDATAVLMMVTAHRTDGEAGLVQFPIAAYLPSDRFVDAIVVVDEGTCDAELARRWRPAL